MFSHEDQIRLDLLGARVQQATRTLEVTPPSHEGRPIRWANSDFYSFDAMMQLEAHVAEHGFAAVPFAAGLLLAEHVTDWRRALPYTDAERARLYEVRREHRTAVHLAKIARQAIRHELIVDAGIERVIDGRELMQRWWRWRRERDQFTGQNGPERAAGALRLAYEELRSI